MTKGLALDAAVGRRDRRPAPHDRAGVGATVAARWFFRRGAASWWAFDRERRNRTIDIPALLAGITERMGWRIALCWFA